VQPKAPNPRGLFQSRCPDYWALEVDVASIAAQHARTTAADRRSSIRIEQRLAPGTSPVIRHFIGSEASDTELHGHPAGPTDRRPFHRAR